MLNVVLEPQPISDLLLVAATSSPTDAKPLLPAAFVIQEFY
jgi:hypothetical protein